MFGSLGVQELLLIFVIILIVFGPRRIPEIGRMLGKALGEFRKATDDLKSTIEREVRLEELKKITPPSLESIMTPSESVSRTEPLPPLEPTPGPFSPTALSPELQGAAAAPAAEAPVSGELATAEESASAAEAVAASAPQPAAEDETTKA
jgi:TatA/E family protein of Tat protein translocase